GQGNSHEPGDSRDCPSLEDLHLRRAAAGVSPEPGRGCGEQSLEGVDAVGVAGDVGSAPQVKKNRTRWKKTGAAKHSESSRSMMPPWPGMVAPKSLTPRSRLIELITRPPANPSTHEMNANAAACHQV